MEIIIYTYLIYLLYQIIIHHIRNISVSQYETNKATIYDNLKSGNLKVPFRRTFLSSTEILELLMYTPTQYQNIITGKPNETYNIRNNFKKIHDDLGVSDTSLTILPTSIKTP